MKNKNLFILAFFLFLLKEIRGDIDNPILSDFVDPKAQYALRDQLSQNVEIEYENERYISQNPELDVSVMPDNNRTSISKLNEQYSDLLYQGDIRISTEQLREIVRESQTRKARTAYRDRQYPKTIWKSYAPYAFHRKIHRRTKNSIITAMRFWQTHTCVKFKPRKREAVYLQYIDYDSGCWSTVGRDMWQQPQLLSIGSGCEYFGITTHEIGHALGLYHEQSRYDRDASVNLVPKQIPRSVRYNFAKVPRSQMDTYGEPYDIGSVMHYRPDEFTVSGKPSILAKNPREQAAMGQMSGPSFLDVQKINAHYQCGRACKNKIRCSNNGYQNPKKCSVCKCPPGFGGPRCEQVEQATPAHCRGNFIAKTTFRRLRINIKPRRTKHYRQCNYHIKAPRGRKIEFYMEGVIGRCIQGCYQESTEVKARAHKGITGYRFCCGIKKPQRFLSQDDTVPIIIRAGRGQSFVQLLYRYVNPHRAKGNDTEIDPEDLENKQDSMVEGEHVAVDENDITISAEIQKAMVSNSTELENLHRLPFDEEPLDPETELEMYLNSAYLEELEDLEE